MGRKIILLAVLCMLLGMGFASMGTQPEPCHVTPEAGTRAAEPPGITENITGNVVWDDSLYDYIYIKNRIWVLEGANLTIEAGVTVRFDPGAGLHVRGSINANGQPFANVTFIPYSKNPEPMSWLGITLENSTGPCVFNNVAVRYSMYGIASWGSAASITNSTIEHIFYYGLLAGEDSEMTIRNNFVHFSNWAGIITDNRTDVLLERNKISTCYYGIVCYDAAEVRNNKVDACWLGIVAWGDAVITYNEVRDCTDGIQGFFAAPLIANNLIISCEGNGTRFITSNAVLRNNTLVYNNVGMDIDYNSRHLLASMENNMVNGIDIKDCFFVDRHDIVIENLVVDSGWSKGFYGSLTAQGSVTLYDCRNVTIKDSVIINTVNSIYATNSTFKIYNSIFDNARRSQIYLDANATVHSFNNSVDPESVMIAGMNCLFQSFDNIRVKVLDYYGEPIFGARVFVRESQLVLHDTITNLEGMTPVLLVKDRTVSESGVISSPLSVEIIAEGYNFDPNPMTDIHVSNTSFLTFTDLGDIFPPKVASFSVKDGDRAFPVNGTITVRFSEPMNETSAEGAFSITGNVTGTFSWEGPNLTFTPDSLVHATYYTVMISAGAMDLWGNSLESPISFSFTTSQKAQEPDAPGAVESKSSMLLVILAVAVIIGLLIGWLVLKRLK